MSWAIQAALAAVIFAAGAAGGIKWHAGQDAIAEVKRVAAAQEITQENERLANGAATGFETDRTKNETRTRIITVEVEKIIDRPVYRAVCLDADGLQLIAAAIQRRDPASQPGHALPGPAAAE